MRIAVVSDIHGNLPALEAVVRDIRRHGVDGTVNLGDSLSGPLLPLETAQFLMSQDWIHLAGNHERQILFPDRDGREASDAYAYSQLSERELDWLIELDHRQPLGQEAAAVPRFAAQRHRILSRDGRTRWHARGARRGDRFAPER